jgi:threonine dehydratase
MYSVDPAEVTTRIPLACAAIGGVVHRTPLEASMWLSEVARAQVALKLECYQPTGSFKVRGALAAVAHLDADNRARGVITASAGNHGLGVAYAAARAGVDATVVVPDGASPAKVAALGRFPITLLRGGPSYDTAERKARSLSADSGAPFISPYNDLWVMAGQGTIAVELLEDMPHLDVVLVPVGGGGMISGIGAWLKAVRPGIRVVGLQSQASPSMEVGLRAGRLVEIPIVPTLADGLAANIEPGSMTFTLAQQVVDEIVLVTEEEIADAIRQSFHELHLGLEGSAVVGIAAILAERVSSIAGKNVAVLVTGRNIAAERLCELLS